MWSLALQSFSTALSAWRNISSNFQAFTTKKTTATEAAVF